MLSCVCPTYEVGAHLLLNGKFNSYAYNHANKTPQNRPMTQVLHATFGASPW